MPAPIAATTAATDGVKRSRGSTPPPPADTENDDDDPTERVPFLTTLSMNRPRLFYGRRDVRHCILGCSGHSSADRRAAASAQTEEDEETEEDRLPIDVTEDHALKKNVLFSSPGAVEAIVPIVPRSGRPEDVTYLHSMLQQIMESASSPAGSLLAETLPACAYLLRAYFNLSSGAFKPQQQAVCFSVLSGTDTLAVCPTGWGKSLCFQFPMLVHRLLFECEYERWCRKTGAPSSLSNVGNVLGEEVNRSEAQPDNGEVMQPTPVHPSLPETIYSRFCVVVSPLLALMEDQAGKINEISHLSAVVLSSKLGADRETRVYKELESPLCSLDILFVSPEKFIACVPLRRLLRAQEHRLVLLCVDEVHCVSGWSYDFRPTFMYVSRVLDSPLLDRADATPSKVGVNSCAGDRDATPHKIPYLCLTATATEGVIRDVQRSFHIQRTFLATDQHRDNLQLQSLDLVGRHAAFHHLPINREDKETAVREPSSRVVRDALLESVRDLPKPMIVYVQSRADADEISGFLSTKLSHSASADGTLEGTNGQGRGRGVFHPVTYPTAPAEGEEELEAKEESFPGSLEYNYHTNATSGSPREALVIRCYHAALTPAVRTATQRQFLQGRIHILVATVAFGMGVDKANIRSVVHASAPSSLEAYVQEVGRAGRDGAPSMCRLLYNPFDFYSLRSRLWSSLLSPLEMQSIVHSLLSGPTTRVGQRLLLASPAALSATLGFTEEAIETVLFLLLTAGDGCCGIAPSSQKEQGDCWRGLPLPFRAVLGSYPLGYKILHTQGDGEQQQTGEMGGSSDGALSASNSFSSGHRSARRRRTSATASSTAGVGLLLRQLGATDAVLELCRLIPNMKNQIDAANQLSMPLAEFQQRIEDLVENGSITVARYGVSRALLLELSEDFAIAASPTGQREVVERLLSMHRGRLDAQVVSMRRMFTLLQSPTHATIHAALQGTNKDHLVSPVKRDEHTYLSWMPQGRDCGRMKAVSIVNSFVEENRLRLHSTYEALRALMGIRPKSIIQYGKYAGQLPLSQSWYLNSPYFGALRTFDLAWVLQVLAPHHLDDSTAKE